MILRYTQSLVLQLYFRLQFLLRSLSSSTILLATWPGLFNCSGTMEEVLLDQPTASADEWRRALEKVVPCCVVLKVTQTRAFDTESASSSYATGFIVDKARGIICTNRHVVTPGPIVAEAIFLNREELPVYPVFYDPVHDFGFLRFDPSKLQFMQVRC
eukprot:GHRQ01035875.1.p1 GENE.GHRQ01035875.1~~GHRQ01035875.1.p1  ORF type:complete len:158 (+),score=31.86 GHRQ01035875.1:195-668(+)